MHRTGHTLLLHHSEGERLRYIADWLTAGLLSDAKVLYADVAGWGVDFLVEELVLRGLVADRALEEKRLEFIDPEDVLDLAIATGVVRRALEDDRFSGVRLAVRSGAFAEGVTEVHHLAFENTVDRLCRQERFSALCQYDARTTDDGALDQALLLHPDRVIEGEISLHRRANLIQAEGQADSLDAKVLTGAVHAMTQGLSTGLVLLLDLRGVHGLTPGAARSLVEGTRDFRRHGGSVRCGIGAGETGALVRSVTEGTAGFELVQGAPGS